MAGDEMAASIRDAAAKRAYTFMVRLKIELKELLDSSGIELEVRAAPPV